VSQGPPGSSWKPRSATEARNANSTRGRHFRTLTGGRAFAYALVLGAVAALVAGAWFQSLVLAAAGPVVVAALVLVAVFASADKRAERDFFVDYAARRDFAYVGDAVLDPLTPLLGAGDRRCCRHWMEGRPAGGMRCGLGHFTYEVVERDGKGHTTRRDTRHFTICVTDLEAGIAMFPGVFLCLRRGIFGGLDGKDWLSHRNRHEVELESAALCERYELWVDDAQDELLLRELFAPSLQVLLAEHPLAPCFEYRAGTLVVYVERRIDDQGNLDWLRDATSRISAAFATEIRERKWRDLTATHSA
jgi:hypothetical protein